MPRVQTYGERKVGTAALPGVRKQSRETFESAGGRIGEAAAAVGNQVARIGLEGYAKIQHQERERADDIANLATARAFNDLDHKLLYSEDKGILNKKGLEPHQLRDEYLQEFDAEADRIGSVLKTDGQKRFYEQQKIQRRDGFRGRADQHAIKALGEYEQAAFQSTMASSINAAVLAGADDLPRVGQELRFQEETIAKHAARLGMPAAATELLRDEMRAKVHTGVIGQLLAQGKDQAAKVYLEETRDAIGKGDAQALERIDRAVNEGVVLGRAQRASDEILARTKTPAEARAAAKQITDPKDRQATLELIEHELGVKERAERQAHEDTLTAAVNVGEKAGSWQAIQRSMPVQWSEFSVGERGALKNYFEAKAAGTLKTNPGMYAAIVTMANSEDPATREAFTKLNLLQHVDQFSSSDFGELSKLQKAVRDGDVKKAEELSRNPAFQTAMVNEALGAMGLPQAPPEPGRETHDPLVSRRVDAFRRSVREAQLRHESATGKPISDTDLQQIVDQLRTKTGTRVIKDGWVWNTTADAFAFEEAQAQADSAADIPAGERQRIVEALRLEGKPVTDDAVLKLFNIKLTQTRKDR